VPSRSPNNKQTCLSPRIAVTTKAHLAVMSSPPPASRDRAGYRGARPSRHAAAVAAATDGRNRSRGRDRGRSRGAKRRRCGNHEQNWSSRVLAVWVVAVGARGIRRHINDLAITIITVDAVDICLLFTSQLLL
jgi:hypothetical protein